MFDLDTKENFGLICNFSFTDTNIVPNNIVPTIDEDDTNTHTIHEESTERGFSSSIEVMNQRITTLNHYLSYPYMKTLPYIKSVFFIFKRQSVTNGSNSIPFFPNIVLMKLFFFFIDSRFGANIAHK